MMAALRARAAASAGGALLSLAALLGGCSSVAPTRDGPPADPPADLAQVPDAVPRVEQIRAGGPNKPYEIGGRGYAPQVADLPYRERGLASWYGRKFHGRPTSNGETYDMYAMTAAHKTWPLPSYARVRNPANDREVILRINDRGPFVAGRVIDLSYTAALKLGLLRGVGIVEIERITHDEIRSGAWRRDGERQGEPVDSDPSAAFAEAARGYWVQLGVFRERPRADALKEQAGQALQALAPLLAIFEERSLHRLQAGPYASRDEADEAAAQIRSVLALAPQVVERR